MSMAPLAMSSLFVDWFAFYGEERFSGTEARAAAPSMPAPQSLSNRGGLVYDNG